MKISNRLKTVADLVPKKVIALDVGCDHALLDIYLVKEKKVAKIYASDVNEKPLENAKENIKREKLDKKIELLLGNGLDVYKDDIDTVIISGMGGLTIKGIFRNNMNITKKLKYIIISPNNYQRDIKEFLTKNGFIISAEKLVEDKKIMYQVIRFERGKAKYSKSDYFFGPVLRQNKDDLFKKYYLKEKLSREILLNILPKNYRLKKIKLKKEIKLIDNEIK
ncbi:MAG: SAM-dependent methyltransferase [Bacilli bacterium]|nr:SAM-dependent methyltransferase [Bacilli bacterium]